jgi:hypothetical protein
VQPVSIQSDIRVVIHVRQTPQYKLNIKVTNKPHVYYEVITMGKSCICPFYFDHCQSFDLPIAITS